MKRRSLSISIPEPCHEDWSDMTKIKNIHSTNSINSYGQKQNSMNFSALNKDCTETINEEGRHCSSCQKTVVDFTRMTKTGIVSYISENEGTLCGRFAPDQLEVNLLPARRNRLFSKWMAVFLGLIPLAGYGQTPVHTAELIEQSVMGKRMMKTDKTQITKPISEKGILTGKLIDAEAKEPIMFGNVASLKEGIIITETTTDLNGIFSIDINDIDELEFSYIGYQPIKKSVADMKISQKSSLTIEIEMHGYLLGVVEIQSYKVGEFVKGDVCTSTTGVTSFTTENDSWLKRQWKKLKRLLVTSHDAAILNRETINPDQFDAELEIHELEARSLTSVASAIAPQDEKVIIIYPNPSIGLVTIKMSDEFAKGIVQITDVNNQIIHSRVVSNDEYQYDGSNLLSGSYIISIISDNELIASEVFIKI